jgi:hypothetical protein
MIFGKRVKELEVLARHYRNRVDELEQDDRGLGRYVPISVPRAGDSKEYNHKLMELVDNEFMLFYFTAKRLEVVKRFERDKQGSADYYRGQLALLDDIIEDSRSARGKYRKEGEADAA